MKTINFVLDKDKKITIQIPDLPNKVNYYYEPTEKIHKFDEGTVSFVDKDFNIELKKEILNEIVCPFYALLKKALHNELQLPDITKIGHAGYALNSMLHNKQDDSIPLYWLWAGSEHRSTLLYNANNTIYLEIVPLYPWLYRDKKPSDNYISFDEFMKTYKPYVVETIPIDIAKQWLKQCEELLKNIDSEC